MDLRTFYVQLLKDSGNIEEYEVQSEDYRSAASLIESQYLGKVVGVATKVPEHMCSHDHRLCCKPGTCGMCIAPAPQGFDDVPWTCSRPKGHSGPHISCGLVGHNYRTWT